MRDDRVPMRYVDSWSERLDHSFKLRAGTVETEDAQTFHGPVPKGVRVGLMISGEVIGQMDGDGPLTLTGPCIYMLANNAEIDGWYSLPSMGRAQFISVVMSLDEVENSGLPLDRMIGCSSARYTRFNQREAGQEIMSLALQISTCPLQGAMRAFYIAGKALEFVALVASDFCAKNSSACAVCPRLCPRELKRIHDARNILLDSIDKPPSLRELGRLTGMNVKKLTEGFRAIYGKSVFEVLQDDRLEKAYVMLTTGKMNVSQVAYEVGYSVAHFSTAFRRRFGVSPSSLRLGPQKGSSGKTISL